MIAKKLAVRAALLVVSVSVVDICSATAVTPPVRVGESQVLEAFRKLPVTFEQNNGQFRSDIGFVARTAAMQVGVERERAVLQIVGRDSGGSASIAFAGSAPIKFAGNGALETRSNYFIGDDVAQHVVGARHFSELRANDLYRGIDLRVHGDQRQVEYDFIVRPGANPHQISITVSADELRLTKRGDLQIRSGSQWITQKAPVAYQELHGTRKPVTARYRKHGKLINIAVGKYDRALPLIIDPVLTYSTYLGSTSDDWGYGIAVDSAGNAYVAGVTASSRFPTANAYDRSLGGSGDAFVTKFNVAGSTVAYSTYIGGSKGGETAYGIAVDASGNVYVTGTTSSSDYPVTAGPYQTYSSTAVQHSFVTKLNAAGSALAYSTVVNNAYAQAIAIDSAGSAYVVGYGYQGFATTSGALKPSYTVPSTQSYEGMVLKLNATGTTAAYATFLNGPSKTSNPSSIAVDSSGNAYVVGSAPSDFPVVNAYQATTTVPGAGTAYVAKLNASGSALVYSTFLGGSKGTTAYGVAVDAAGSAVVVGSTYSADFPVVNAFKSQLNTIAEANGFVTKFSPSGKTLVYSTYVGGRGCLSGSFIPDPSFRCNVNNNYDDEARAVALDSKGNAYVVGIARAAEFPTVSPILTDRRTGNAATVFFTRISPLGYQYHATLISGSGNDYGRAVAVDSNGAAYITGNTYSTNFPTASPFQAAIGASTTADAFATKISAPLFNVSLTSGANNVRAATPVSLSTTVSQQGSSATPTGTAKFLEGVNLLSSSALSAGGASASISGLSVGIHQLAAVYINGGDGGSSPALLQAVNQDSPCGGVNPTSVPANAPFVVVTSPTACTSVTPSGAIALQAAAADPALAITTVSFYANGALVGSSSTSPYSVSWTPTVGGVYTLTAIATNANNASTTSAPIQISVTAPPAVHITSPSANTSLRIGSSLSLAATANDPQGANITSVQFFDNGALIGSTNVAPYTLSWTPQSTGAHTITAKATDNLGAVGTSDNAPVVTVVANVPPSVSLTAPGDQAVFVAPATITFQATASDSDGSVVRVDFIANGGNVASTTTAPFSATWNNVAAGTYSILARATDNDGASANSTARTVTVNNPPPNQPPQISISAPITSTFATPVDITVTANASDTDGTVTKVEFFDGTTLLATRTAAPYSYVWKNVLPGAHSLIAKATDDKGSSASASKAITVTGTAVSITSPSDGFSVAGPATYTISGTAATSTGTITRLDFYDSGALIGTLNLGVSNADFGFQYAGVAPGAHVHTVIAVLSGGGQASSPAVTVNVSIPPSVILSAPATNAFAVAPAFVRLAATTSNFSSQVARVDYYAGTTLVSTSNTAPFSALWANAPAGQYQMTAKAIDLSGAVITSAPVSLTVGTAPQIAIDSGINGSTVADTFIAITGTVAAPPNSGVTINGVAATLLPDGRFFMDDVPVKMGANSYNVQVSTQDGASTSTNVSVTGTIPSAPFHVFVDVPEGIAAHGVTFKMLGDSSQFGTADFDVNGDGIVDFTASGMSSVSFSLAAGYYVSRISIKNASSQVIQTITKHIFVWDPVTYFAQVKDVFDGMLGRLGAGYINAATTALTESVKEKYMAVFQAIGAGLPGAVSSIGEPKGATFAKGLVEIMMVRMGPSGSQYGFRVSLLRGADGIWRVDGM